MTDETEDVQVAWLRTGSSGVGWLYSDEHYETVIFESFEVGKVAQSLGYERKDFYSVLNAAFDRMPPSPERDAIENALGRGVFKGKQLADRRRSFASLQDISERTLLRHEAKGAQRLIEFIKFTHAQEVKADSEDIRYINHRQLVHLVLDLRKRLEKLESATDV